MKKIALGIVLIVAAYGLWYWGQHDSMFRLVPLSELDSDFRTTDKTVSRIVCTTGMDKLLMELATLPHVKQVSWQPITKDVNTNQCYVWIDSDANKDSVTEATANCINRFHMGRVSLLVGENPYKSEN